MSGAVQEDAYFMSSHAASVLQLLAKQDGSPDALWGLYFLAQSTCEDIGKALETRGLGAFEDANIKACSLLGLMDCIDADNHGGGVFYGAQSLLRMAKAQLDEQWTALELAGGAG